MNCKKCGSEMEACDLKCVGLDGEFGLDIQILCDKCGAMGYTFIQVNDLCWQDEDGDDVE